MIIYGKHRTGALAQRHARAIERQRGLPRGSVFILRQNAFGRFSTRGRHFVFEFEEAPPPPPPPEKEIKTLKEFLGATEEAEDFDDVEIDGGADYGEEKEK